MKKSVSSVESLLSGQKLRSAISQMTWPMRRATDELDAKPSSERGQRFSEELLTRGLHFIGCEFRPELDIRAGQRYEEFLDA
jgi:hypothetical protein